MNSVPWLLRQSLRPSLRVSVSLGSSPSPRKQIQKLLPSLSNTRHLVLAARQPGVCLQCQLRTQSALFSSSSKRWEEKSQAKDENRTPTTTREFKSKVDESSISETEKDKNEGNSPFHDDERLPSETERRRSSLAKQFSHMMDNIQGNVFIVGQRLNDLTGYSGIEKLKKEIDSYESRLREARALVRKTKDAYSAAINRRSASQREVNELLQRKHAWSSADLERFTSLYRSDHANEVAEAEAQEALTNAERELEEATSGLNRTILSRYHEEQIWSDKIRRMSTWGTWGLMGVNVLLFLVFQIAVEPWRRQRLVRGFEEKVKEAIENNTQPPPITEVDMRRAEGAADVPGQAVGDSFVSEADADVHSMTATAEKSHTSEVPAQSRHDGEDSKTESHPMQHGLLTEDATSLEYWMDYVRSFFSERRLVLLTQRDLTLVSLQSAAAGAAAMGLLIAVFRPH